MSEGIRIRAYQPADWPAVWAVIEPVLRAGETYPLDPAITEAEARHAWTEAPQACHVAVTAGGEIIGTYYIKPNQPSLGAHVCNCGYIVSEAARGMGVASAMCEHSQQQAMAMGFRAMQYNLVVATNTGAFRLWKRHGFQVVGVLPGAFRHPREGYVDAYVMYKQLEG